MPTSRPSPAVVFIHGIGGSARVWAPQVKSLRGGRLRARWRWTCQDTADALRSKSMDFEGLAADVEAAIDARGLNGPILVGHSMGGMVAQTALRRRPARLQCRRARLYQSGLRQRRRRTSRRSSSPTGWARSMPARAMADLAPAMVDRMIGPAADPAGRVHAVEVMSVVPADTYRAAVRCLVGFDERANLPKIAVPVLCLAGEKDPNAPAAGVRAHGGQDPRQPLCLSAGRRALCPISKLHRRSMLLSWISCARCWHSDTCFCQSGCHGRACPDHPSIRERERAVGWILGTSPRMTAETVCHEFTRSRPARHRGADLRSCRVPASEPAKPS